MTMAHFALLENNVVVSVIVAEAEFIASLPNAGNWLQTSVNTFGGVHALGGVPLRKNYASVGFTYDPVRDAFIPPQPFPSWVLEENTCQWAAPVPYPTDSGAAYMWDENARGWRPVESNKP